MTTKQRFRSNRFRLEVRERDHGPPHVHLVGGGYDVVIELHTLETVGEWPRGLRNEVMGWIELHHAELLKEWNKWHR